MEHIYVRNILFLCEDSNIDWVNKFVSSDACLHSFIYVMLFTQLLRSCFYCNKKETRKCIMY